MANQSKIPFRRGYVDPYKNKEAWQNMQKVQEQENQEPDAPPQERFEGEAEEQSMLMTGARKLWDYTGKITGRTGMDEAQQRGYKRWLDKGNVDLGPSSKDFNMDDFKGVAVIFDKIDRSNDDTERAQAILNKYLPENEKLELDGFYGPKTQRAVESYIGKYSGDYMWQNMKNKVESIFD